jgi:hypothetical protein
MIAGPIDIPPVFFGWQSMRGRTTLISVEIFAPPREVPTQPCLERIHATS